MAALPISIHNVNTSGGRRRVNRVCTSSVAASVGVACGVGEFLRHGGQERRGGGHLEHGSCCAARCARETSRHHSCSQRGSPSCWTDGHVKRAVFERCASVDVHSLGLGEAARDAAFSSNAHDTVASQPGASLA